MKPLIKMLRARESEIDHELARLRKAIVALGGGRTQTVGKYSHEPWTAERRKKFEATMRKKKLAAKGKRVQ